MDTETDLTEPQPAGEGEFVVAAGDSFSSIAAASGHLGKTLWEDPANAGLKAARGDPELLLPGDRVTVLPLRPKRASCTTGKRHVFRLLGVPVKVTLVLQDEDGEAFAGKRYELIVEGKVTAGTSDDEGKIECAINPAARHGTLKVWLAEPGLPAEWTHEISLGALYPIEHLTGVQQRLANLGLYVGEPDGAMSPATAAAIKAFQAGQKLELTGAADDATRSQLKKIHCV
jgi:hypothetical protein